MPLIPHSGTAQEAAALVVARARARGIASAEIEDQAGILLVAFAQTHPNHPVADYFDRADDGEIEEFFDAVARELRAAVRGTMHVVGELSPN